MPSWNIHIGHVEQLLEMKRAAELGIEDANAFLFGNFVPDIYVGFMVPDATYRINYCITHHADYHRIPLPDADDFWDNFICRRKPTSPEMMSLTLGAWAHLATDRHYNSRFREFLKTLDAPPSGEELRIRKQSDFDLFGKSLGIKTHVEVTPELLEAAKGFRPYSVLADDVFRSADVARAVVRESSVDPEVQTYRILDANWMTDAFCTCGEKLATWLETWQQLEREGLPATAAAIRAR